jgi:hypothetical protein
MRYLSKQSIIPIRTLGTMPTIPCSNPRLYDANNHQPNHTSAPFQTIHNPILYTRYLSKPSTFPIRTLGTDHDPNRTLSTFPNHPHSQSIHKVPFETIHIPNPYAGYQPQPNPYSRHLSNPTTIPIHTQGTLPSYPQFQSVHWVQGQTITGQLTSRRMEDHNLTENSTRQFDIS